VICSDAESKVFTCGLSSTSEALSTSQASVVDLDYAALRS